MKRSAMAMAACAVALFGAVAFGQQSAVPGQVNKIKVQPDQAADCSTLKSIVESVTRDCKSNDQKAVAVWNFMLLTHYHCPYAQEPGLGALKEINVYGWGLCGGTHCVQSALWKELGWNWRYIGWANPGHTTVEAEYDGKWHYLDNFLKLYAWIPDGKGGATIASQDDYVNHRAEIWEGNFVLDNGRKCVYFKNDQPMMDGKPNWRAAGLMGCDYDMCSPDKKDPTQFSSGVPKSGRSKGGSADAWGGYAQSSGDYSTDVNLAPAILLTNTWDPTPNGYNWSPPKGFKNGPMHSCGHYADICNSPGPGLVLEPYDDPKTRPNRTYADGTLSFLPNFGDASVLKAFLAIENVKYDNKTIVPADAGKPAFVIARLASPYVVTLATGDATGADSVEISADDGKTFKAGDLKDFAAALKNKYSVQVKLGIKTALSALKMELTVEENPGALPYLSPGKNMVAISVGDPASLGDNKLVVTYAYRLGSRSMSLDKVAEKSRIANQTGAKWSDQVTYVQKAFTAKDLPAKIEIDCPTPKGQFPVYPRMVFLRREVVSPTGAALPLPEGAVEAKVGPDDELASMPSPFTVGIEAPKFAAAAAAQ